MVRSKLITHSIQTSAPVLGFYGLTLTAYLALQNRFPVSGTFYFYWGLVFLSNIANTSLTLKAKLNPLWIYRLVLIRHTLNLFLTVAAYHALGGVQTDFWLIFFILAGGSGALVAPKRSLEAYFFLFFYNLVPYLFVPYVLGAQPSEVFTPDRFFHGLTLVGISFLVFHLSSKISQFIIGQIDSDIQRLAAENEAVQHVGKVGGWWISLPDRTPHLSDQCIEIFGLPKGSKLAPGESFQYFHPEDREKLKMVVDSCIRNAAPYNTLLRLKNVQGKDLWVRSQGTPILNKSGKVKEIRGTFQDVTSQKKYQEEVERLKGLLSHGGFAILASDLKGIIRSWSEGAEKLFGYTAAEMIGSPVSKLHTPEQQEDFVEARKKLANGDRFTLETTRLSKTGKVIPVLVHLSMLRNKEGEGEVLAMITDLSEQKSSIRRLEMIAYASGMGLWDWNLSTNEVIFDERWCEIVGYEKEELARDFSTFVNLCHPEDLEKTRNGVNEYLEGKKDFYESKFRLKHKKGHWVPILSKGKVTQRASNGTPLFLTGIHFDLSNIQRIGDVSKVQEEVVMQHSRLALVGELAGGIGHEINNPLFIATAKTTKALEKAKKLGDPSLESDLTIVRTAHARIRSIVDKLRSFISPLKNELEEVDLKLVLEDAVDLFREISAKEGIEVVLNTNGLSEKLFVNSGRIQEVIMNLIGNSLDAKAKEVTVSLQDEGHSVSIEVQDNGKGIEKEHFDRIFETFFSTKEVGQGTGMGLSTSKSIIESMGGSIECTSHEKGRTVFRVVLPKKEILEPSVPKGVEATEKKEKGRLLIVEDESEVAHIVREMCEDYGFETIEVVPNGAEAQKRLKTQDFDFLLTDLKMPHVDGFELINWVKKQGFAFKIIAMTGGVSDRLGDQDPFDSVSKKIDGSLLKPFEEDSLFRVFDEVIESKTSKKFVA